MTTKQPRLTDNDHGEITVDLEGKQLRGWTYSNDDERRQKMAQAREYVEGWCDGRKYGQTGLYLRSLHIRHEFHQKLAQVDGMTPKEVREIVDRLVPYVEVEQ